MRSIKSRSKRYEACSDVARGNNPNPLRSFAIFLEKHPTGLLAGGAFAPYKRFATGKTLAQGEFTSPEHFNHRRVERPAGAKPKRKCDLSIQVAFSFGGGGESRTPVRKRFPRNFSGRRRLFWESCSPSSLSCRQAVTPTGQVSFIVHGRFKALPAHVHHETTPVPGPWSSRVRRPLFKQRRERYRYRSLIYKLHVFRWSGATARYSCFRVPVETGTPPRRHKVCSAPFPPGGESCAGSLAPPHRTGPACAGLRFGWRLRRRARSSYFNPAGHSAPQA